MSEEDLITFRAAVGQLAANHAALRSRCRGGACDKPVASHCPSCYYGYCTHCTNRARHALQCRYSRNDCLIVAAAEKEEGPKRLSLQEAKVSTDAADVAFTLSCVYRSDAETVKNKKWYAVAWTALRFGGLTAALAFMFLNKNHQLTRANLWSRLAASPSMDVILCECADMAEASFVDGSSDSLCAAGRRACEVVLCQDADWILRNHPSLTPKLVLPMLDELQCAQLTEAARADALKIVEHGFLHDEFHCPNHPLVSRNIFRAVTSPGPSAGPLRALFLTKLLPCIVANDDERYYVDDASKALPTLLQAPECDDESVLGNLAAVLTSAHIDDVIRTLATCHSDAAGSLAIQLVRRDDDAKIAMLDEHLVASLAPHLTPTLAEQLFWEVHLHMCAVCETRTKVRRCGRCKLTYYCSPAHQAEDWNAQHKRVCQLSLRERMAAALSVDRVGDT